MRFIKKIIEENWFQEITPDKPRQLTFTSDIESLTEEDINKLIQINNQIFSKGHNLHIEQRNDVEGDVLSKLLHVFMLAEFYLDNLLYWERDLRFKEIDNLSKELNISSDDLLAIYKFWYDTFRGKVMPQQDNG